MPSPALSDAKIQASKLIREHTDDFVQVYQRAHNREPNDDETGIHMDYHGRSELVSCIKPNARFKVDELSRMGVAFVDSAYVSNYVWVDA